MSKWIISSKEANEFPFHLEKTDLQISSLDELAYLLEIGKLVFIEDVMNESFCNWISKELKDLKKGESLKQILKAKTSSEVFFQCVFRGLIYIDDEKIKELMGQFADGNLLKESQRYFHKGNQFFRAAQFRQAIFEYRQALSVAEEYQDEDKEDEVWKGKVWHNLGNCYMYDLHFKEAINCFQTAYLLNFDDQTQRALILAKQVMDHDEIIEKEEIMIEDEKIEQIVLDLRKEVLKGIR